jgi:hypothetical protein
MTHKVVSCNYGCRWLAIGILIGTLIGIALKNTIEDFIDLWYPMPHEVVCQKGILFEQIMYGGSVYRKTNKECIETALEEVKID